MDNMMYVLQGFLTEMSNLCSSICGNYLGSSTNIFFTCINFPIQAANLGINCWNVILGNVFAPGIGIVNSIIATAELCPLTL